VAQEDGVKAACDALEQLHERKGQSIGGQKSRISERAALE
jgi:hypothetical protein